MIEQRYCILQDDDGHYFLINMADVDEFHKLLEGDDDGLWTNFNNKFGGQMLSWHLSAYNFTDPRTATGEEAV